MSGGHTMLRVLSDDGRETVDGVGVDVPDADVVGMMTDMLTARQVSETMVNLQRQGRAGTFSPIDGQEASAVGSVWALDRDDDWVVPAYREIAGLRSFPHERMLPLSVSLATQIPHAVGLAWGLRLQGRQGCVLVYFGDGATSEGDFYEGGNFAGVFRVPLVMLCVNNGWAISTPRRIQTAAERIADKAAAFGFPGVQVDGNDVLAVHRATRAALERARAGEGPTLIEAVTYRYGGHTTADDPTRYVPPDELASWRRRDPIPRFRAYLETRGLWSDSIVTDAESAAEVDVTARLDAAAALAARPDAIFDHVYATPTARLLDQQAEMRARLGLGAGEAGE